MNQTKTPINTEPETDHKLTLCSQLFYPELVSTGQTLTELCEVLVDKGIDIDVFCGPPTLTKEKAKPITIYKGIKIYRTKSTRFNKLHTLGKLINHITFGVQVFIKLLISKEKSPILVVTNPPFLGYIIAWINRLKRRPFIYLVFDVYPETGIQAGLIKTNSWVDKLWRRFNTVTFRRASYVISIGRCMTKHLQTHYAKELKNKMYQIPVWSNDTLIQSNEKPSSLNVKKDWHLENQFIVLYSGNMGRFHDMETILNAAIHLRNESDITFLFVGDGYKKEWCVNTAKHYHLTNCIFKPYVSREDLPNLLAAASVGLVSLMKGQEGLSVPSKTFGLLAKGIPTIAVMAKESEISYLLEESKCGVTIEPNHYEKLAKTIQYLRNNRPLLSKMSINGKKTINETYNLNAISDQYVSIMKELSKNKT